MIELITKPRRRIMPQEDAGAIPQDDAACHVCGKDCVEGWFACIHQSERRRRELVECNGEGRLAHTHECRPKLYLCGPACALMYFDVPHPPAHDHQARHEYYRVRSAVCQAAWPHKKWTGRR